MLTCKRGSDVVSKDAWFNIPYSTASFASSFIYLLNKNSFIFCLLVDYKPTFEVQTATYCIRVCESCAF